MSLVLRVGLSGGIGSGKSTVARRLAEHGAIVIDADVIAREVVEPGSAGLAELVERFGPEVLDDEGALDRPAMAARVFGDDEARAALNAITHPRIGARTAELMAQAPEDAIVVHDMPLLVEAGYAANYHLVLIVDAPEEDRVQRLVERGLEDSDARARIRAQATEEQRRAAADVWLDNSGPLEHVTVQVDRLWQERLVPFEANARHRRAPSRRAMPLVEHDADWADAARRWVARISQAAGERALRVDHIGATAVPDLVARDVLDVQLAAGSWSEAQVVSDQLAETGFPRVAESESEAAEPARSNSEQWRELAHLAADPARAVDLRVRVEDTETWRAGLLLSAWLQADQQVSADYGQLKRDAAESGGGTASERYREAKRRWLTDSLPFAEEWAEQAGWRP